MMTPTLENRLKMRERPQHRTPVMYVLFAYSKRQKLYAGRVWHHPYELADVEVTNSDENVLSLDGFLKPASDACHKIMSQGFAVEVFGLEELN